MNWQQLFQKHILDRGYSYSVNGYVEDYYKDEVSVRATVQGSEPYNVAIGMKGGTIFDMSCDCPYAEAGNYCKHMAAVLLYKTDADEIANSVAMSDGEKDARILVQEADDVLVRNFLTGVLESDERLLNRFKSAVGSDISLLDMRRYKNMVDGIFVDYGGKHGFIDYYNASAFFSELDDYLNHDVVGLMDNGNLEEAFELTNYIFVKTANQDMDDSDGGSGMLADRCLEIWQAILESSDLGLKRKMFQWYVDHLDGSVIDYMEDYIERILFEYFMEDEFLDYKLNFTEKKVKAYSNLKDSWTRDYHTGKWALNHIEVMQAQNMPENLIDEYCTENLELSIVRRFYIDKLIQRGKYDEAIGVLEEGKTVDKESPGLVADYSLQLRNLYKLTGNSQAYEKELLVYVLKYKAGDVSAFIDLKSFYPIKEWEDKREDLFNRLPPYAAIDILYKEEKLYDRLLKCVLDSTDLFKLMEYEKYLKPLYPNELLLKYETAVKLMAGHASNRKHYKDLVSILRRMQKYPGGMEAVKDVVSGWKLTYRNRPAMMDELSKI